MNLFVSYYITFLDLSNIFESIYLNFREILSELIRIQIKLPGKSLDVVMLYNFKQ